MSRDESTDPAPKRGLLGDKSFTLFLIGACGALAVLVVLLAMQNRAMKVELGAALTPQLPPEALSEGDLLAPLELLDESGAAVTLAFSEDQGGTLLLLFSPKCPACRETIPVWSSLLKTAPPSVRIMGLRLAAETETAPPVAFPVYTPAGDLSGLSGRIPYVPATLLLDSRGVVKRAWYGALGEEDREALRDLLAENG